MNNVSISNYSILRKRVEEILLLGQRKIEQEKIRTYWQTGKLIHTHILHHKDRADYGQKLLGRLSDDLGVSSRLLYDTLALAKKFPILPARAKSHVTWSHLKALLGIHSHEIRNQLIQIVETKELTTRDLEKRIRKESLTVTARQRQERPLIPPTLGEFWTYQLVEKGGELLVDLGFKIHWSPPGKPRGLKAGDIVTSIKNKSGSYSLQSLRGSEATAAISGLYTYQSAVDRVIDGDTIVGEIDLGFSVRISHTVRLRGIDAFELDTKQGKEAKSFVERELRDEKFIALKSTRDDKYGRYLSDIMYGDDKYLNQLLLDKKLAVRV